MVRRGWSAQIGAAKRCSWIGVGAGSSAHVRAYCDGDTATVMQARRLPPSAAAVALSVCVSLTSLEAFDMAAVVGWMNGYGSIQGCEALLWCVLLTLVDGAVTVVAERIERKGTAVDDWTIIAARPRTHRDPKETHTHPLRAQSLELQASMQVILKHHK